MASISSLGIGSGLQLADILDSLTKAEKEQLTPVSKYNKSPISIPIKKFFFKISVSLSAKDSNWL